MGHEAAGGQHPPLPRPPPLRARRHLVGGGAQPRPSPPALTSPGWKRGRGGSESARNQDGGAGTARGRPQEPLGQGAGDHREHRHRCAGGGVPVHQPLHQVLGHDQPSDAVLVPSAAAG